MTVEMSPSPVDVSKRLAGAMKRKDMTALQVAYYFGVSPQSVYGWLRGIKMHPLRMERLAELESQ